MNTLGNNSLEDSKDIIIADTKSGQGVSFSKHNDSFNDQVIQNLKFGDIN
jgi:hypothetical protein